MKLADRVLVGTAAFALGVIPLIARLYVDQNLSPRFRVYGFRDWWGDLFCWYKDLAIFVCAVLSLAVMIIRLALGSRWLARSMVGILAALCGTIALSWVASPYRDTGLWGVPGTYGGVLVNFGYLVLAAAAATIRRDEKTTRLVVGVLGWSLTLISFWGLPEVFGIHLLMEDFSLRHLLGIDPALGFQMTRSTHRNATAMFGHSNYMGTYGAMMGPFFLILALGGAPSRAWRAALWLCTTLSWALLVGSFSRTGYLAGFAALIFVGIFWCFRGYGSNSFWRGLKRSCMGMGCLGVVLGFLLMVSYVIPSQEKPRFLARIQSIWRPDMPPKPPLSSLSLEHNALKVQLGGDPLVLHQTLAGDIELRTPEGSPAPSGYGGFKIHWGVLDGFPLLEIAREGLNIKAALTHQGFRVLSRQALLKPENPLQYLSFIDDDLLNRRGFIWKRTLPLIFASPWLGYGPGSFILTYPNRDFTGFLNTFGSTDTLIDKPHNFYLQYAHAFGLPALGLMLTIFGVSLVRLLSLDAKVRQDSTISPQQSCLRPKVPSLKGTFDLACAGGLVGFVVSGLANDSMSGVSVIAWVFVGFGLSGKNPEKKETPPPTALSKRS